MDRFIVERRKGISDREILVLPRNMISEEEFKRSFPSVVMIPPEMPEDKIKELSEILDKYLGKCPMTVEQVTDVIKVAYGHGLRQMTFYSVLFGSIKEEKTYPNAPEPGTEGRAHFEHLNLSSLDGKGAVVIQTTTEMDLPIDVIDIKVFCLLPNK